MKYIETLREGERISSIYFCKHKQSATTKNGKPYENVIFQDKTGTLDGKIWDPNSQGIDEFDAMDYVEVVGEVTSFQGALQLNVKRVRKAHEGEYLPEDYQPVSNYNVDEMYAALLKYVKSFQNPYIKKLAESFFVEDEDFIRRFKAHSAAKSVHHGFMGGLLEHTLRVTNLCAYLADTYRSVLNRDLLLVSAMLHDMGKLRELAPFPVNDYTDDGQLLGHIMIGVEEIGIRIREIPDFPEKLASEIKHCIIAHHGELEYGSPKKPALPEAVALSHADNLDAKMETLAEAFAKVPDGNTDWLGYNRLFESNIRKSSR